MGGFIHNNEEKVKRKKENISEQCLFYCIIIFVIIIIIIIIIIIKMKISEHILLITMLTIKILFTINSLKKKTFPSRHYLQFLSFKKTHLVLIRKNSFN